MEHAASLDSLPVHFSCPFTGRAVCRCLCGTGLALQDGSASSAEQHMRRARAVWRTLHHPGGSIPGGSDPAVLWLPKLVKRGQQQQGQRAGGGEGAGPHAWVQPATPGEAAAAVQRAEAAVQQAEAAARAAVLRAASLAAAVGLPYRPPPALGTLGAALDAEVAGLARADYSQLERGLAAVRAAQEARQQAAAAAVARAAAAAESTPVIVPLAALGGAGSASADGRGSCVQGGGGGMPEGPGEGGGPSLQRIASTGRTARRSRSGDPGVLGEPAGRSATSSGSGGRALRRSASGKAGGRPPPSRVGRAGPGEGGQAARARQQRASAAEAAGEGAGGAAPPDLAPFGTGYRPRGPSAATPPKQWLLRMGDFRPALLGRLVQTYWADGGRWWPAVVQRVCIADRSCALYYETGDEEVVDFAQLIQSGEVAWLEEAAPPGGALSANGKPIGGDKAAAGLARLLGDAGDAVLPSPSLPSPASIGGHAAGLGQESGTLDAVDKAGPVPLHALPQAGGDSGLLPESGFLPSGGLGSSGLSAVLGSGAGLAALSEPGGGLSGEPRERSLLQLLGGGSPAGSAGSQPAAALLPAAGPQGSQGLALDAPQRQSPPSPLQPPTAAERPQPAEAAGGQDGTEDGAGVQQAVLQQQAVLGQQAVLEQQDRDSAVEGLDCGPPRQPGTEAELPERLQQAAAAGQSPEHTPPASAEQQPQMAEPPPAAAPQEQPPPSTQAETQAAEAGQQAEKAEGSPPPAPDALQHQAPSPPPAAPAQQPQPAEQSQVAEPVSGPVAVSGQQQQQPASLEGEGGQAFAAPMPPGQQAAAVPQTAVRQASPPAQPQGQQTPPNSGNSGTPPAPPET